MRISITGKNIEISEYLRELVEKKMAKLDRYFPEDTVAHVTMSVERNRHIVEVTIPFVNGIIRGEEVTGDMYASIDNVLDKLDRQIRKHRTKLEKTLRADAFVADRTVNPVSEVDRRRSLGQVDDLALGREDEDLVAEEIDLE